MCGVPVERAEDYLNRLIGQGHRVAVCEQIEDPAEARKRGAKSVVRRQVVRLVTPGTITEELLLDPVRANSLLALAGGGPPEASLGSRPSIFQRAPSSSSAPARPPSRPKSPASIRPKSSCPKRCSTFLVWHGSRARRNCPLTPLGREAAEGASAERRHQGLFRARDARRIGRAFPHRDRRRRRRDSFISSALNLPPGPRSACRPGFRATRGWTSMPRHAPISN